MIASDCTIEACNVCCAPAVYAEGGENQYATMHVMPQPCCPTYGSGGAVADCLAWLVPCPNKLTGGCLTENHPGRGTPFAITLGVWNKATNEWIYSGGAATAIDWRYGVPYPDAGSTGLFEQRTSDDYGTIWEVVALDCSSPGDCGSGSGS